MQISFKITLLTACATYPGLPVTLYFPRKAVMLNTVNLTGSRITQEEKHLGMSVRGFLEWVN